MKYLVKATHPVLPKVDTLVNEEDHTALIATLQGLQYVISDDVSLSEWEEFTVLITHEPSDRATEDERAEVTEQFESELYRLVKKYQGRAGLRFDARNTESEIVEW